MAYCCQAIVEISHSEIFGFDHHITFTIMEAPKISPLVIIIDHIRCQPFPGASHHLPDSHTGRNTLGCEPKIREDEITFRIHIFKRPCVILPQSLCFGLKYHNSHTILKIRGHISVELLDNIALLIKNHGM